MLGVKYYIIFRVYKVDGSVIVSFTPPPPPKKKEKYIYIYFRFYLKLTAKQMASGSLKSLTLYINDVIKHYYYKKIP